MDVNDNDSEVSSGKAGEVEISKTLPEVLADVSVGEFRISVPDTDDIESFIHMFEEHEIEGNGEVIISPPLTNRLMDNTQASFPTDSYIEQLANDTDIEFRVYTEEKLPALLITPTEAYYRLSFGHIEEIVRVSGERFRSALESEFRSLFRQSSELEVDIPAWEELIDRLAQSTNDEMAEEFKEIVETLSDEGPIDEVLAAIIAGARTEVLLYEISKWGEDAGISSKATFSRRKTNLEEKDIITTESAPVEIGRPRERLLIQDEEADIRDIVIADS
jgi:hypothetical protein